MATTVVDPTLTAQEVRINEDGLKFITPFSMMIAGPSQSGKSEFIWNLIKFREDVCMSNFTRIIYCQANIHSPKNKLFFERLQNEFPKIEMIQGLPDIHTLRLNLNSLPTLIIIDDLMKEVVKSSPMADLATNDVHNHNISIIFVFQNYFARGQQGTSLIKNCHYKVLFYNRIELLELRNISTHTVVSPKFLEFNFNYLIKHFPNDPSHYIVIDGHNRSQLPWLFCKSHIFPKVKGGEIKPLIFFVNPNYKK